MPAIADRVKETSTSTGNGNITLAGASLQFQSFNTAFGTSNPFYYVITDANGTDWEIGTGELSNSTTLVRTTVHQSSNSDNKIVLSSGTHSVFCAAPEVFLSDLASKSGKLSQFAATTSLELAGVISDETGSGALVFANSPAFTTPNIGTPSSGTLTNCTDLPIGGINGLGTGVGTALAVNTGTAGAFVVNGGALGTPLSGTVTNLTGTASININGTVGATTPNTGAFTSITSTSASGVLTRAAATQDGVAIVGRGGGTSSYEVSLTPTTLTADRTLTLPDETGTVLTSASATILREIDTQTWGSSTTYTIPAGAKVILVECISAGGGGGGGARNTSTSTAGGGGGGAGGGYFLEWVPVSLLSSPVTVTIGAGGTGGNGRTASTGNGSAGQRGGLSRFGTLYWVGGGRGIQGTTGGGGQGGWGVGSRMLAAANKKGEYGTGGIGGSGSGDLNGRQSHKGGGGGGGGGNAAAAAANGGAGGASSTTDLYPNENSEYVEAGLGGGGSAGVASGGAGGAGTSSAGGGGGASNRTGTGGAGGNGASPGGGGGGGGGGNANNDGGNGGTGGNAQIKIWVFG